MKKKSSFHSVEFSISFTTTKKPQNETNGTYTVIYTGRSRCKMHWRMGNTTISGVLRWRVQIVLLVKLVLFGCRNFYFERRVAEPFCRLFVCFAVVANKKIENDQEQKKRNRTTCAIECETLCSLVCSPGLFTSECRMKSICNLFVSVTPTNATANISYWPQIPSTHLLAMFRILMSFLLVMVVNGIGWLLVYGFERCAKRHNARLSQIPIYSKW